MSSGALTMAQSKWSKLIYFHLAQMIRNRPLIGMPQKMS